MKYALIALSLLAGDAGWEERQEAFAGLTCPTPADVNVVASVQQEYAFAGTVETRTRCLFMAFGGQQIGETGDFAIGSHLYSFKIVRTDGFVVYVLQDKGEGSLA